jgi:hypothetical protein
LFPHPPAAEFEHVSGKADRDVMLTGLPAYEVGRISVLSVLIGWLDKCMRSIPNGQRTF